ncbi:MAG: hypothetical protein JRH11_15905 [Deltaproteobacteria bacterium]|nr:hypothetical protein [Deltaproteobacteria bacterium]
MSSFVPRALGPVALIPVLGLALAFASACGDDGPAAECVPSAADTCNCDDGRLGVKVCASDSTWGACMCRGDDGGTDSSVPADASMDGAADAGSDAAADAAPDAPIPDAGVMFPPTPGAYTPGPVSRITSLTIPSATSCCRDWGAASKNGAGTVDNAFSTLAEATAGMGLDLQALLTSSIAAQTMNILLDHQGFDGDPDSALIIVALDGVPDGGTDYLIDPGTFLPGTGTPRSRFEPATLISGAVVAGPGTLTLPIAFFGGSLEYSFEDVQLTGTVTTGTDINYTAGTLAGYLRVEDYFGGVNDYVAAECSCLGLSGPLYSRSGTTWSHSCVTAGEAATLCPGNSGCQEISAGADCTVAPLLIPSLADIDVDSTLPGYEGLSLGLRFTAAPVTVSGVAAP